MAKEMMDPKTTTNERLLLQDLAQTMASCFAYDPGPDPTWDPGEFPEGKVTRYLEHHDPA